MTTRWARVVRGWIAALVATFVAACSHALSGGSLPGTAGLALCLAFSGMVSILLAGRSLSLVRLAVAVTLSQAMFHSLFSLMTDPGPGAQTTAVAIAAGSGMRHGAPPLLMRSDSVASVVPMSAGADLWMWVGHAVAAIVTIALLALGERAFWGLTRLAGLVIGRLLATVLPAETAVPLLRPTADRAAAPRRRPLVLSVQRHRGPPALASVC
jgi:hypothetical protein